MTPHSSDRKATDVFFTLANDSSRKWKQQWGVVELNSPFLGRSAMAQKSKASDLAIATA
jgi:hypothetical protein